MNEAVIWQPYFMEIGLQCNKKAEWLHFYPGMIKYRLTKRLICIIVLNEWYN